MQIYFVKISQKQSKLLFFSCYCSSSVSMGHGGRPWVSDFNHGNYQAAKKALMTGTQSTVFSVRQCYVLIALSRDRCMTVITGVTFKRDHCTTEKTATNFFSSAKKTEVTQSVILIISQYRVYFFFKVFGSEPDMTREGGSIPVTLTLQEATGKNVMLLPLGACDDGAHSQNEKMDRKNYIEGVSIVAFSLNSPSK